MLPYQLMDLDHHLMEWSLARLIMICIAHREAANFVFSNDWPIFMESDFAYKGQFHPRSVQSKVLQQSTYSLIIQRIRSNGTSTLLS